MEEVLLNVDSRYRDIFVYPNESKFKYNLEKMYKNIISARMVSIEVNNSASYLDDIKKNNFLTIHLPNKINDPEGIKVQLDEGLYQNVGAIQNMFNGLFQDLFNTNNVLQKPTLNGKPFAEKYFYFFYLNYDTELIFDFNTGSGTGLTLKQGWYSIYGLVLQIQNYLTIKYNERIEYKNANPGIPTIPLDSGNFTLGQFYLPIFDRRFRNGNTTDDCVRYDPITQIMTNSGNFSTNLTQLKNHIYGTYLADITTFIPQTSATWDANNHGILDLLNAGEYLVVNSPNNNPYSLSNEKLLSESIYYLNIAPDYPTQQSTQIYNLSLQVDPISSKVSFANYFTKTISTTNPANNFSFYYYYTSLPGTTQNQNWNELSGNVTINLFDNLFSSKKFLYEQKFITLAQYTDPSFKYTSEKDIAEFEIDFSTYILTNPTSNGLIDIKKMNYPPVGYYLGYRPNLTKTTEQFIFKGIIDTTQRHIKATKVFDTIGNDYLFLRINDWGYIDFFSKKLFAKVLLINEFGKPNIDDYVNKEYRFRQPIDINKLDIELVDYLGNTIDLGGFDWSFTLEFKQVVNSMDKTNLERNALVFKN